MNNYAITKDRLCGHKPPVMGSNEAGEAVIIEATYNKSMGNGYRVMTSQNNGWLRVNTYWENGVDEETYER